MRWTLIVLAAASLALFGCDVDWPASMANQPSVDSLTDIRPAPAGSVPVGGVEHLEDRDDDEDLADPVSKTPAAVARGKWLFSIHCAECHGPKGHGHGTMSKVFPPAPDLRHDSICHRSDGYIYGTITAGGRAMPSLRAGLSQADRWDLVAFVREVQKSGCITPNTGAAPPAPGGAVR